MRIFLSLAILLLSKTAAAQESPPEPVIPIEDPEPERPWAVGIAKDAQTLALEHFRSGNDRFAKSDYPAAIVHYRQGLKSWDHPALHGNLAVALIRLEQPLAAFDHLTLALRWGATPLESHVYEQLITSQKLLENQLARISVVCKEADASEVTLDGDIFTTCPTRRERYALAGTHELVARKPDYVTLVRRFTASPGQVTQIEVSLTPLTEAVTYERRFDTWKPWAVLGSGIGLTLIGAGLKWSASSNIDSYDQEVNRLCPDGCPQEIIPKSLSGLESRAKRQDVAAIGSFVVGGGALAAGAVLLYLNRPHRVQVDAEGNRLTVSPQISGDGFSVAASINF